MTDTDTIGTDAPVVTGPIQRSFAIDDLIVRSDGDGRTVEAYAAVFGQSTEIRDQYGHYYESIDRTAFDGVLKRNVKPAVFFNHGRDIFGNPSDKWSAPVAVHRSASADGRGLRVSAWFVKTPAGDEALELMRSGAVDGFSFSGKPNRSRTIPAAGDDLPTVVRQELSLAEYGPAVFRAYDGARVLAMRSVSQIVESLDGLQPDQFSELIDVLRSRFPDLVDLDRSGDHTDADNVASPDRAADEFTLQRRLMAARLRGLI